MRNAFDIALHKLTLKADVLIRANRDGARSQSERYEAAIWAMIYTIEIFTDRRLSFAYTNKEQTAYRISESLDGDIHKILHEGAAPTEY